jgi:hypothetical protein
MPLRQAHASIVDDKAGALVFAPPQRGPRLIGSAALAGDAQEQWIVAVEGGDSMCSGHRTSSISYLVGRSIGEQLDGGRHNCDERDSQYTSDHNPEGKTERDQVEPEDAAALFSS